MQILDDVKELSPKLLNSIPKLKENDVAVFRLKNAFVKDGSRDFPSCPEFVQLSGVQQITDPYEVGGPKSKKIATFIKGYTSMGGGSQARPVYQALEFKKGELRTSDPAIYQFAMRNKDNESNFYRKQMGAKFAPKFELVGTKRVTSFMQLADMRYQAEKMIRESSWQYLKEVAAKMNTSPDAKLHVKSFLEGFTNKPDEVKYELIQLAHTFPKQVMGAHPDQKTQLRVQIYDAQVYAVLTFDGGAYWLDTDTDMVELHKPEADIDKVESLITYLMSEEGKKNYQLFAKMLRQALNVTK